MILSLLILDEYSVKITAYVEQRLSSNSEVIVWDFCVNILLGLSLSVSLFSIMISVVGGSSSQLTSLLM